MGAEPAGHTAAEHATGELSDGVGPDGDGAAPGGGGSGPWWRNISRRQWLTYGGIALSLFLVVMAVITIIELSVGKPLDAAVWGKHSTGTSIGNLMGGRNRQHTKQPADPAHQHAGHPVQRRHRAQLIACGHAIGHRAVADHVTLGGAVVRPGGHADPG